jgi:hypothetical protein
MTEMRRFKFPTVAFFSLLALLFLAPAPKALAQRDGPRYLHAISDLRTAREYLKMVDRREGAEARRIAIDEISHAIDDMKRAAADDGKNLWHMPPPESGLNPEAPGHSAARLMREAREDVQFGRDFPENAGLQVRSLEHIDNALRALQPWL